jgi:hypothetical protein
MQSESTIPMSGYVFASFPPTYLDLPREIILKKKCQCNKKSVFSYQFMLTSHITRCIIRLKIGNEKARQPGKASKRVEELAKIPPTRNRQL